jgi:hypothetical protein
MAQSQPELSSSMVPSLSGLAQCVYKYPALTCWANYVSSLRDWIIADAGFCLSTELRNVYDTGILSSQLQ